MKAKTSVTLEANLLKRIDSVLRADESRSAFFMDAARQLAEKRERAARDERDLALLAANADTLNADALDNLEVAADLFREHGEVQP